MEKPRREHGVVHKRTLNPMRNPEMNPGHRYWNSASVLLLDRSHRCCQRRAGHICAFMLFTKLIWSWMQWSYDDRLILWPLSCRSIQWFRCWTPSRCRGFIRPCFLENWLRGFGSLGGLRWGCLRIYPLLYLGSSARLDEAAADSLFVVDEFVFL